MSILNKGGNFGRNNTFLPSLKGIGISQTDELNNRLPFGIENNLMQQSFSGSTPATITLPKPIVRPPFAIEPKKVGGIIAGGLGEAIVLDTASRLVEIVPKIIAFTLANYKATQEKLTGKEVKPLQLPFDARRLGFNEQVIKDVGTAMVDDFIKRQQESPNTHIKNIVMSVLENPISQVFDIWVGEAVIKTAAISGLKITNYDPFLRQSINRLGLNIPIEKITPEIVKQAFNKEFQILAQSKGTTIPLKQQFDELGRATATVMNRLYNKGIPQLSKLGQIVQDASEAMFKNITPEEVRKIPIGLSIKDVSGKGKISSVPSAGKGIISPELQPLAQEARKYKSAEEFVKGQIKVYHGGSGIDELGKGIKILSPEEKLKFSTSGGGYVGLSTTLDREYAQQFSKNIGGTKKVLEIYINPKAKIKEISGAIDDMSADEISVLSKEYDVLKSVEENEFRILNADVAKTKSQLTDFYNQVTKGVKETKPLDEFEQFKKKFGNITPEEEKRIFTLEFQRQADIIKKQTEGQLFKDIRQQGGIRLYKKKFMAEELQPIPLVLKNSKGLSMDEMADALNSKGYNFNSDSDLLQAILNIRSEARRGKIKTLQSIEKIKLLQSIKKFAPKEISVKSEKLINRYAKRIIREHLVRPPMRKGLNAAIIALQKIAEPSAATTFYRKEEIQSWIKAIKRLQSGKELSNMTVSRIKKALRIENIKKADQAKLQKLYDFMSKLEKGDAFLSPNQLIGLQEILKGIERPDLVSRRIIINKFGEVDEIMGEGIMSKIINELVPSVDIKEGHPLVSKIVDKADNLLFQVEKETERRDNNFAKMIEAAEKSRKLSFGGKIKQFIAPQNKIIFQAMSGASVNLTKEEVAVVVYLKNFFKKVRIDLQLEKYRKNYITHLEKSLSEKIVSDGLIKAVVDIFNLKEKENVPLNIMLELDNIIGSKKFFRFALERKGGISPTINLRRIVHSYSSLYETKKALDQILPEGQAIVQILLKPKTAVWLKRFLQNLKGRGLDYDFRSGKMAWLSKLADNIVDIGYIKLLGLNYWSALKNLVAGEANSFIYQDLRKYLLGKQRCISNPIKSTKLAFRYGALEGTFADYAQQGIGKLKRLQDLMMIGQRGGEYEIRVSLFASELTQEEFMSGEITPERIRQIKDIIAITQGIFSKTDSPLWLQTWYGRLFMQMNRWRITNVMLLRRLIKEKNYKGLSKAFILYGIGMYLSYELGKAGHKRAKVVAQSMAEAINSVITLITLKPITDALTDNPTFSVLKEITYSIQELANYIRVPGIEKPRGLEFQQGIEETWIAPVERTKELFGKDLSKEKIKPIKGMPSMKIKPKEIGMPSLKNVGIMQVK
uniref:Uncharacterized protein n=1 Tax=viral metagenome TaxID=1070528 RepID=A0A6H1ZN54_9ZZZZ